MKTLKSFHPPSSYILANFVGGVWGGVAALPRPPQCAKAPRRCGATSIQPWSGGRGGSNRRRLSRFFPHILHKHPSTRVDTSHPQKRLQSLTASALSAAFSLTPQAQRKPIAAVVPTAAVPAADNPQKRKCRWSFALCGARRGTLPHDLPLAGEHLLKKAGENLKAKTAFF